MQNFKTASDMDELLGYLRNPGGHITHRETVHSKKTQFVLSMIGQLYIQDYRLVQFLRKDAFLVTRMSFAGGRNASHCIVYVLEENIICSNRYERLKMLADTRKLIDNLPMEGEFRVLILFCKNASYSQIERYELSNEMAPPVHHLKNERLFGQMDGRKPLSSKYIGTKLHSVVEKYILGAGVIRSREFLDGLRRYKLRYDLNIVTNTINYIIGKEMLEGGYEVIGTEKLYMIRTNPPNFNRLDLLLRRKDKVLVIDWKFSRFSARDYIKAYRSKVRNYLKIAKKQYDCEVEFHLYCIHLHLNGFMYNFSAKTEFLPVQEITVADDPDEELEEFDEEILVLSYNEEVREVESRQQPYPKTSYYIIDD